MKRWPKLIAFLLLSVVVALGQDEKQQQKPTLGPQPGPATEGPQTAVTVNRVRLLRVKRIYVERIDNQLSDKLLEALAKTGRFKVVAERGQADGVIRGTCFDSRRLKILHSEIYLSDRSSGDSIWQDNIRQPINPPAVSVAVSQTAEIAIKHLAASIMKADRP